MNSNNQPNFDQLVRSIVREELSTMFSEKVRTATSSPSIFSGKSSAAFSSGITRKSTSSRKTSKGVVTDPSKDKRLKANRENRV